MAFNPKKLVGCDSSDYLRWCRSTPAENFIREVKDMRDISYRKLLKEGSLKHDENASTVKAYNKILDLIEGVQ